MAPRLRLGLYMLGIFFGWFGSHSLMGVPLDIPAHFLGGYVLYWIGRRAGMSASQAITFLIGLALLKEVFDWTWLKPGTAQPIESMKDVAITWMGGGFATISKNKKRPHTVRPSSVRQLSRRTIEPYL